MSKRVSNRKGARSKNKGPNVLTRKQRINLAHNRRLARPGLIEMLLATGFRDRRSRS